jgi:diadenylate cyclase
MEKILSIEWLNIIKNIVDICAVAYLFYFLYSIFENTNSVSILKGFIIILILNIIAKFAGLKTLEGIFQYVMNNFVLLIVVLFQPEIRKILNRIGQSGIAGIKSKFSRGVVNEISQAVAKMAEEKVGALILIEQNVGLKDFIEGGVILNCDVSKEAIWSIFYKGNPLHDGAIVISEDKILAARVLIPSIVCDTKENKDANFGTRHRAGIYVTQDTDAVAIVVSEEKGSISLGYKGKFEFNLSTENFVRRLNEILGISENDK